MWSTCGGNACLLEAFGEDVTDVGHGELWQAKFDGNYTPWAQYNGTVWGKITNTPPPYLSNLSWWTRTPDGSRHPDGGGVSYGVPTNQVFDAVPASMSSTVTSAASALGLQSVQTSTMHVLQDAVVITAISDSPATDVAAYLQKGGLQYLLGQSPMNFEGVYFEVDDTAGNRVYIAHTAPRDGGGGWWADPSIGIQGDYHPVPSATG